MMVFGNAGDVSTVSATRPNRHGESVQNRWSGQIDKKMFKIIVVGDSDIGKTCFLKRYFDGTYEEQNATAGLDCQSKIVELDSADGLNIDVVKLFIWDTAGSEKYHSLNRGYYKDTDGILFCFDVTENSSFEKV